MKLRVLLLGVVMLASTTLATARAADDLLIAKLGEIEQRLDARVGLAVYDTGSERRWLYHADERFALTSTFKAFACATLLDQRDLGERDLDEQLTLSEADLVPYAPVTEKLLGQQLSLGQLCAITLRTSDNLAANKVLDSIGGAPAVTAFMRRIGDDTTRLDRREPELNQATPGDLRDTTSPAAIATSLGKLILGDALSASSREQLTAWLVDNQVGGALLRAGIPTDWRIADRSGAGAYGSRSVIAVIWPPRHEPLVVAIYMTGTQATMAERDAAIAELGEALVSVIGQ